MNTRPSLIQRSLGLVLMACAMSTLTGQTAQAQKTRFVQDRFAVGFWVDPPADKDMARHYADIARANFTLVIGGFGARTPETVEKQLQLCQRLRLKALVDMAGLPPEKLPESPACWGYRIKDEPVASDFPGLKETVEALRKARPGKLGYINLFPNYASLKQLGVESYEEHVRQFVEQVDPDVLCMDHYPAMRPDKDTRDAYCRNLDVLRRAALERDIPFWNFFNTMPFGNFWDPTEAQLRWQIYTSLAYGAKGVLYFCYWTPVGKEFPKGGAIITADGRKTRHYEQARRINAVLKAWGPTLMKLTSTAVHRIQPEDRPADVLAECPLRDLSPGDYLVGEFTHADGRRAVLLNNYRYAHTAWPTVMFDVDADKVLEVSPENGRLAPVIDDSPAMDGLQISLDAGEGRLFILPKP